MISIQDKHAIYDILLQNGSFYNKNLKEYINKYTPNEFEEIDIKMTGGHYILVKIDGLYDYGIELENMGDFYRAGLAYNSCEKIDKDDPKVHLKLFLYHLSTGNSLRGVWHLRKFQINSKGAYRKLGNFLMLLESYIMSIPFKEEIKSLTFQDILIDEGNQDEEIKKKNEIRKKVFVQDLDGALQDLSEYSYDPSPFSLSNAIRNLLITAKAHRAKITKTLPKLIEEGTIFKAYQLLNDERERHNLIPKQQMEHTLLKKILSMMKNGGILSPKKPKSFTVEELIETNNFLAAYDLLLDDDSDNYETVIALLKKAIRVDAKNKIKAGIAPTLEDIHLLLQDGQIEKCEHAIGNYLCRRELEDYYYLFVLLLRTLKNEVTNAVDDLIAILERVNPGYEIDHKLILELYRESLHKGDKETALTYTNILKKAARRGHTYLEEVELLNMISTYDDATTKPLANTPIEQPK